AVHSATGSPRWPGLGAKVFGLSRHPHPIGREYGLGTRRSSVQRAVVMVDFDRARLYRGSDLSSLNRDGTLPPSVASAFAGCGGALGDAGFPCPFARGAFKQDRLVFLLPGKAGEQTSLCNLMLGLSAYLLMLSRMPKIQAVFVVLNVLF